MSQDEAIARMHIRDLIARYPISRDADILEPFVDNFTDDAVFESGAFSLKGKAAIHAHYSNPPKAPAKFRRHNMATTQIDFTGPKTAKGRVYYFVNTDKGPDHSGYYLDEYREENGRWLFSYRGCWVEWASDNSVYVPDYLKRELAETGSCGPKPRK